MRLVLCGEHTASLVRLPWHCNQVLCGESAATIRVADLLAEAFPVASGAAEPWRAVLQAALLNCV